jgi:hypothetical protein
MSFDYTSIVDVAIRQIKDKGRSVTLKHVVNGAYDPQTDTNGADGSSTQIVKMVITKFKSSEVDGTMILKSDKRGLLATDGLTTAPLIGDLITDGGVTYTIVDFDTIQPGDTVILYKLQLRK